MATIESMSAIAERWHREGRAFRPREVADEWRRQSREHLREREDAILVAAEASDASELIREIAIQVRDHRAAGNYTTQG